MNRITLEVSRDEKSSTRYDLFEDQPMSPVCKSFLQEALGVFKPKALEYISLVTVSDNAGERPHQLWVDYRTSFVNADFADANDDLTPFGQYLKEVDGWLYDEAEELCDDEVFKPILRKHFWNPEWPMPLSIKLNWEMVDPPYDLRVVCAADTDQQLVHLLLHSHLEDLLGGMLPILEEFLNQKVSDILQCYQSGIGVTLAD